MMQMLTSFSGSSSLMMPCSSSQAVCSSVGFALATALLAQGCLALS